MLLDAIDEKVFSFYCHLLCRHVTDNKGDVNLELKQRSQIIAYACFYYKSHKFDVIRLCFKFRLMQPMKKSVVFMITSIFGILLAK